MRRALAQRWLQPLLVPTPRAARQPFALTSRCDGSGDAQVPSGAACAQHRALLHRRFTSSRQLGRQQHQHRRCSCCEASACSHAGTHGFACASSSSSSIPSPSDPQQFYRPTQQHRHTHPMAWNKHARSHATAACGSEAVTAEQQRQEQQQQEQQQEEQRQLNFRLLRGEPPAHFCGPLAVAAIPGRGRGLIATRPIAVGELLLACQPLVYLLGQPGEEELPDPEGLVDQLAELQRRAAGGAGAEGAGRAGAGATGAGAAGGAAGAAGAGVGAGAAGTSGAGGVGGEGEGAYDSALGWIQGMYRGGELPNGQGGGPGNVALLDALLHRPPMAVPPSVLGAVPPSSSGAVQPSSSSGAAPLSSSGAGVTSLPTSELDALVSFNAFGDRFDDPVASAIATADARRRGSRRGDAGGGRGGGKAAGASVGEATAGAAGRVSDGGEGPGLRGGAMEAGEQREEEEQEEGESVGTPHVGLWPHFSLMNHSCLPNTIHYTIGPTMVVRAAQALNPGDEVTVSYLGTEDQSPAAARRAVLQQRYGFRCACPRCRLEEAVSERLGALVSELHGVVSERLMPEFAEALKEGDGARLDVVSNQLVEWSKRLYEALEAFVTSDAARTFNANRGNTNTSGSGSGSDGSSTSVSGGGSSGSGSGSSGEGNPALAVLCLEAALYEFFHLVSMRDEVAGVDGDDRVASLQNCIRIMDAVSRGSELHTFLTARVLFMELRAAAVVSADTGRAVIDHRRQQAVARAAEDCRIAHLARYGALPQQQQQAVYKLSERIGHQFV